MPFIEHIKPEKATCRNPEHNPPKYIVLPAGTHIYQCPSCGEQQAVEIADITL